MHDIVHELDIPAPAEAVFAAVSTVEGLTSWLAETTGTATAGGTLHLDPGTGHTVSLSVDECEAPELVHWTCTASDDEWAGTQIAVRVEPTADGATVRFWHGGWEFEDGELPRSSFRWAMALDRLRASLSG